MAGRLQGLLGLLRYGPTAARRWVRGSAITVSPRFSIRRVSERHSNSLHPVKRLQLTLTGFSQLRIAQFGFLAPRLREATKTIASCSPRARCLGGKKSYTFTFRGRAGLATRANETLFQKEYSVFKELFNSKTQDKANYIAIKGQSRWLAVLRTG